MRRRLDRLRTGLQARCRAALTASRLAHVLFFLGILAIVTGFGLIYKPAGFIIGGAFGMWLSFLIAAGEKGNG